MKWGKPKSPSGLPWPRHSALTRALGRLEGALMVPSLTEQQRAFYEALRADLRVALGEAE